MAKKFGKFLFATAIVTAAAGAYMYLKKKVVDDDFDEFDEEDDFDEEDAGDEASDENRSYVSLDLDSSKQDNAEAAPEQATEATGSTETEEYFDDEDPSMDAM